jgi:hypothetical protein
MVVFRGIEQPIEFIDELVIRHPQAYPGIQTPITPDEPDDSTLVMGWYDWPGDGYVRAVGAALVTSETGTAIAFGPSTEGRRRPVSAHYKKPETGHSQAARRLGRRVPGEIVNQAAFGRSNCPRQFRCHQYCILDSLSGLKGFGLGGVSLTADLHAGGYNAFREYAFLYICHVASILHN